MAVYVFIPLLFLVETFTPLRHLTIKKNIIQCLSENIKNIKNTFVYYSPNFKFVRHLLYILSKFMSIVFIKHLSLLLQKPVLMCPFCYKTQLFIWKQFQKWLLIEILYCWNNATNLNLFIWYFAKNKKTPVHTDVFKKVELTHSTQCHHCGWWHNTRLCPDNKLKTCISVLYIIRK